MDYSIQQSIGLSPGQQQLQQPHQQLSPNSNLDRNGQSLNNNDNKTPPGFVKVKPSSLTEIHPVLDYDDDEYYDDDDASGNDNGFPGENLSAD